MNKLFLSLSAGVVLALAFSCHPALADVQVDQPAPDFGIVDSNGYTVRLADFKGKEVVLEWTDDNCAYVRKWYNSGEMQRLQKDAADRGIIWLTVVSSAPGQQGFVTAEQANIDTKIRHAQPARVLLDPIGNIGHMYGATTAPEIYVIGKDGYLDYMGSPDSIASTDPEDIQKAEPYVREAIDAVAAGQPVKTPVTRPYGCNVQYGS